MYICLYLTYVCVYECVYIRLLKVRLFVQFLLFYTLAEVMEVKADKNIKTWWNKNEKSFSRKRTNKLSIRWMCISYNQIHIDCLQGYTKDRCAIYHIAVGNYIVSKHYYGNDLCITIYLLTEVEAPPGPRLIRSKLTSHSLYECVKKKKDYSNICMYSIKQISFKCSMYVYINAIVDSRYDYEIPCTQTIAVAGHEQTNCVSLIS